MQSDPYETNYDPMSITGNKWIVSGQGAYFAFDDKFGAHAICAALNVAYLLGKLEHLQSVKPDRQIP